MRRGSELRVTWGVAALAVVGAAMPVFAADVEFVSRIEWQSGDPAFGGFSGLEVSDDGERFVAVSDRGSIATGNLHRQDSTLTAIELIEYTRLLDPEGDPVRRYDIDAEGLAVRADGRIYVSFEAHHRVWTYRDPTSEAAWLPRADGFDALQNNSALEALAIDAAGALYALPERSGVKDRPFPVFRYEDGSWADDLKIPRHGEYLPVGADFGPDGWFYLLERDFIWFSGFATRIRRFQLGENGFENEETLLETSFGTYDNLEGIAAWRASDGHIVLTLLSDDNFRLLQITEFVEFRVREAP